MLAQVIAQEARSKLSCVVMVEVSLRGVRFFASVGSVVVNKSNAGSRMVFLGLIFIGSSPNSYQCGRRNDHRLEGRQVARILRPTRSSTVKRSEFDLHLLLVAAAKRSRGSVLGSIRLSFVARSSRAEVAFDCQCVDCCS